MWNIWQNHRLKLKIQRRKSKGRNGVFLFLFSLQDSRARRVQNDEQTQPKQDIYQAQKLVKSGCRTWHVTIRLESGRIQGRIETNFFSKLQGNPAIYPARNWPDFRPDLALAIFRNFSFLVRVEKLCYSARPTKISIKWKPYFSGRHNLPSLKQCRPRHSISYKSGQDIAQKPIKH